MGYAIFDARNQAASVIAAAAKAAGYAAKQEDIRLEAPKGGDAVLACTIAFVLAKGTAKSPKEVAEAIAARAECPADSHLARVSALNGFLNVYLSDRFMLQSIAEAVAGQNRYGASDSNAGRTAIVEYSSPNVGKPMHIGHIRSTIVGSAVASLLESTGYKVVRLNFLGEAGAQVAGILVAIGDAGLENVVDEKDLLGHYVEISKKIEADPAYKKREQDMVAAMENADPKIRAAQARIREITLSSLGRNYARLGVRFDEMLFDSDFVGISKKMVDEAVSKGLAFKDKDGEIVGKLEEKSKLSNLIILRSNGTTLYSTRDMGFAQWRWEKYRFDKSIVVTASEQNTHFRQVFKLLELMGKEYADRLVHIGFGLVFLSGGVKLSSRKGTVLLLEDVLDDATAFASEQVKDRGYSPDDAKAISDAVGIGAVKFGILKVSAEKNINFSIKGAVSFEGDTGAYLQYTVVRARNILRKAGMHEGGEISISGAMSLEKDERELARLIAAYPDTVANAAKSMAPHQVCDYALKVAAAFSAFYSSSPVLDAGSDERKALRLALVAAAVSTLESALGLLGIAVPEKM